MKTTKKGNCKKRSLNILEDTQVTIAVAKPNKEVNVTEDEIVEEYWVDTSGQDAVWCEHQGGGDWYEPEWCQEWSHQVCVSLIGRIQIGLEVLTVFIRRKVKVDEL